MTEEDINNTNNPDEVPLMQIYEHAFTERANLLLRLESIFAQIEQFKTATNQYETKLCLQALYDLFNLSNRYELRAELLREIDRMRNVLLQMTRTEKDDDGSIEKALTAFSEHSQELHASDNKAGNKMNIKFLNAVKNRGFYQEGCRLFELPAQQHWLMQPAEQREKQISVWADDFAPIKSTVDFLLNYIRDTGDKEDITSDGGIFINNSQLRFGTRQILRIGMNNNDVFPYVSGDNSRFVIRFMTQNNLDEPAEQTDKKVKFNRQVCGI